MGRGTLSLSLHPGLLLVQKDGFARTRIGGLHSALMTPGSQENLYQYWAVPPLFPLKRN